MPNRIPLIVNATANQIQELPVGDGLTGISSITVSGVGSFGESISATNVNATTNLFVGSGTTITSTSFKLTGNAEIYGSLFANNFQTTTGVITATTFSGTATTAINLNLTAGSATSNYLTFSESATGNQPIKTNTSLTYNASTNTIAANISGNSATATSATTATTLSNAANITTGTIASARLSGTYAISISGNANTATSANSATSATSATTAGSWSTGRTISLTGAVTGTSASFDGSSNLSFATTLANSIVGPANLTGGQSGSAPIYGARAWVNFDGTNGSIRASGNVSSVTRSAAGDYTVNYTTAIQDASYSVVVSCDDRGNAFDGTSSDVAANIRAGTVATGSVRIIVSDSNPNSYRAGTDSAIVTLAVFR